MLELCCRSEQEKVASALSARSIDESALSPRDIRAEFASRRRKTQTEINNSPLGEAVSGNVLPDHFRL